MPSMSTLLGALTAVLAAAVTPATVAAQGSGGDPPFIPKAVARAALMDLYKATAGDSWTNKDGWGSSSDHCGWYGVTCVYTNHNITTGLSLKGNNLVGSLPDSIGNLGDLKELYLGNNKISGPIPETLSTITQLRDMDMSYNQLTGPLPKYIYNQKVNVTYPIGTLLRSLDLSNNQLAGQIPDTWFGPPQTGTFNPPDNLMIVNLRYNKLTGSIPTSIATASKLTTLLLSYNQMSGDISGGLLSTWLGTRKYCDLSGNNWGTVDKQVQAACMH